jgi:hypothetical protein
MSLSDKDLWLHVSLRQQMCWPSEEDSPEDSIGFMSANQFCSPAGAIQREKRKDTGRRQKYQLPNVLMRMRV